MTGDLLTTVHVLEAAHRAACRRVVITGSLEEPDDAQTPAASPYAVSKRAAGDYAELCHRLYALPVVTARIFMTYGPSQRSGKLIPQMIESFAAGRPFDLRSAARPVDWIHVDDVTQALLLCAALPGLDGRTIDIGSGALTTVGDLARLLAGLMGTDGLIRIAPADRHGERVRHADLAATEALLGWRPRISLGDGLLDTIAAMAPKETVR
jgi:nucleoside-diphosphate-sugar epimerase